MSDERLGLIAREARAREDPLAVFSWASEAQRKTAEYFLQRIMVHHRAANKAGKTHGLAAPVVACARMEKSVGGLKLPRFIRPPVFGVLVQSHKQQIHSSQKAYLDLVGDWPHECTWVRKGVVDTIFVRPRDWPNENIETWGQIVFFSQDSADPDSIQGQRWAGVHADEPPVEQYWREAIKNAPMAGISETPVDESEWGWLRKEFDGCLNRVVAGRIELTSSVYDNRFLPKWEIKMLEDRYIGPDKENPSDPYWEARLYGKYCDVVGSTPWGKRGFSRLQDLISRCEPGIKRMVRIPGYGEMEIEEWFTCKSDENYILSADLAEGIDDDEHDPLEFLVGSRTEPLHIVRYSGYDDAANVGSLSASLADGFNDALIDFDATGGYGQAFARGLQEYRSFSHPNGYRKVTRQETTLKPGKVSEQWGYKVTPGLRADCISAIRGWLDMPPADGDRLFRTWSRETLESLSKIKIVKLPGGGTKIMSSGRNHDEAMFVLGRFLILNGSTRVLERRVESPAEHARRIAKEMFGRDVLKRFSKDNHPKDKWRTPA